MGTTERVLELWRTWIFIIMLHTLIQSDGNDFFPVLKITQYFIVMF